MPTYLLKMEALDAQGLPTTLRFSSAPYMDAERNYWNPVIQVAGLYKAGLYAGKLLPSQRSGYGETTLMNLTGELDFLVDYAVDGREATLYRVLDGGPPVELIRATTLRLVFEPEHISVRLRDPAELFNENHPREFYKGDNILPEGLEGTEDDIKGQPKPVVFGSVSNAAPTLVNSSKLIYQISAKPCKVIKAWDNGAVLDNGGDYTDLDDLQSNAPEPGEWKSYQGYLRLGASPVGGITVDATTETLAGDTVLEIVTQIGGTFCPNCVDSLNSLGNIGYFLTSETTTMAMLDSISEGVGCYWRVAPSGEVRMAPIPTPSLEADWMLPDYLVFSITRTQSGAGENGLPIHKISLNADKIETVQKELVGGAEPAHRARVAEEYRAVSTEDAEVKTRHPMAQEWEIASHLKNLPDAQAVADHLLSLMSVRRDTVEVEVALPELTDFDVLQTVRLHHRKLGYQNGRNMLIIGITLDSERDAATLNLWG